MSKSPGYEKWPNHNIKERRVDQRVKVEIDGEIIAESSDVVRLDEEKCPARYYFPRSDVKMDKLQRSETATQCPFKGTAQYFSVTVGGKKLEDSVWTYEDPYDEHLDIKDRLAFYDDKYPDIRINVGT